ncbi:MFS transporter [Natronospirillum operosum]|uniref:MFS transporter n=2 Tax=Natronospirillum operosum TaxID=2759953 RepID=A0A4Z0W8P0_9GAMM|nr:MFS transporter [Natronospirillum operosum]
MICRFGNSSKDRVMTETRNNLWVLIGMQAFSMTAVPMMILVGGIIGAHLAPNPQWATLPVAALVVGTAFSTLPASFLMQRWGRKAGFLTGNLVAISGALVGSAAVMLQNFWLVLVASLCFGFHMAFVNQYRFAAMESVPAERQGQAVSYLLLGGVVAAIVGPEAGALGENLLGIRYQGSFLILAGLLAVGTLLILFGFRNQPMVQATADDPGRPWPVLLRLPLLWLALLAGAISYSIMSLVMTAAPVSMHEMDHHSMGITKTAIQAHILAMFLPSLATAWLIRRFGPMRLLVAGLIIYLLMIVAGLAGRGAVHYTTSLILLGVGWNFLFVSGTTLLGRVYIGSERFRLQGLNDFLVFGTQALATLSAGWLIFQMGWDALLWFTLPPMILLGLVALWAARSPARQAASAG